MPIMREILFAIFCTCGVQLMCSSSVNPKKLNSETRSSGSEFNSSAGTRCSIFLCGWWKIMNSVLLTFTDNLFIRSHSCTHESSLLLLAVTSERLFEFTELEELKEHNGLTRFVSSECRIALKFEVAAWISFISIINKRGPKIDPCGTPVERVTTSEQTLLYSVNWSLSCR